MSTLAETKVITAHLPLHLADKLDAMAAQLDRSRGWIVKQAVSAWVQHEEELNRLTREAMVDVDMGHMVNHSAVRARADSLAAPDQSTQAAVTAKAIRASKTSTSIKSRKAVR